MEAHVEHVMPPAPPQPAGGGGAWRTAIGAITTHPGLALAVIVILIVAVSYQYAAQKGWVNKLDLVKTHLTAPAAAEDEIDTLISAIAA